MICQPCQMIFFLSYLLMNQICLLLEKNIGEMCTKMNTALSEIYEWLCSNKLSLNILKTHYMIFTPRNKVIDDIDLFICGSAIHRVYVTKFLGVQIDSKLNWANHIEYTCKKLSKCVGILAKARKKLQQPCLISLYYSFAYPYFIYCNHVWGSNFRTSLEKLYLLQKKLVRIITSSHYRAHTEPLFTSNQILDIYDINAYMTAIFMYNVMNAETPNLFTSFYQQNKAVHRYNTRIANDLHVPFGRTYVRKFSMRINGALIWNSIPDKIRQSKSLNIFKKAVKRFFIDRKSIAIILN